MDSRAAILTLVLVAACSEGSHGNVPPGEPNPSSSLKDQLTQGSLTLELQPEFSRIDVMAQMGDLTVESRLVMLQGATSLRADRDGRLIVEDLTISLDDVVLHHDLLPPEGVRLMNIQASLGADRDARTTWSGENDVTAEATGELVVDCAIMNDQGQPAPLAPQALDGIPFAVQLERSYDGEIHVNVTGSMTGTFWSWADYLSLSDLDFQLASSTPPAPPPEDEIVQ
jgi:hypothetical protein